MNQINIKIDLRDIDDDHMTEQLQEALNAASIVRRLNHDNTAPGDSIPLTRKTQHGFMIVGSAWANNVVEEQREILTMFKDGDCTVTWTAIYRGSQISHVIEYGKQVSAFDNDVEAAECYGGAVRHSLECIGAFSEGPR